MAERYTGGRTPKGTDPFYLTPEWKRERLQVLRRDGWKCVLCGASVQGKGKSRVDHIKPRKTHPHLAMMRPNLRTLCVSCDNQRHSEKGSKDVVPGADDNGTPLDPNHWWNKR